VFSESIWLILALRRTKDAHKFEPREAEAEICCTQIETETYIHNPLSDLCLETDSRQIHVASNQENGSEHTQDVANTGHWILEQP
jgi:alpha-D-ribose 1-methylphosphonate 5-triphosphate diphosphatase PhnM